MIIKNLCLNRNIWGGKHSKWQTSNMSWTDQGAQILFKKSDKEADFDNMTAFQRKLKDMADSDNIDILSEKLKKLDIGKYKNKKITGANVGFQVKKSMDLVNEYGVHLEARTTFVPTLHTKKDIINLVDEIRADVYTIQQFRNQHVLDPALEKVEVPNPHDLAKLAEEIKPYFDGVVKVKSVEFGEQII